jgi:hypothetical protein
MKTEMNKMLGLILLRLLRNHYRVEYLLVMLRLPLSLWAMLSNLQIYRKRHVEIYALFQGGRNFLIPEVVFEGKRTYYIVGTLIATIGVFKN